MRCEACRIRRSGRSENIEPIRVILDCNVLLQGASNPKGPSGACVEAARQARIRICISHALLAEFTHVSSRPKIARKLALTSDGVARFHSEILRLALNIESVPHVCDHPNDPKDSMILNLAIAAKAQVITSRDQHLLALREPGDSFGSYFLSRFGHIDVLTPVQLLERLRVP